MKYRNTTNPTEVFMMRPLPKPAKAISRDYQFKNTRRNFNQLIDKLSRTMDFKPLNIDTINSSDKLLFDKSGDLSDFGQERLWVFISEFIRTRDHKRQLAAEAFVRPKEDIATQTENSEQQVADQQPASRYDWDQGEIPDPMTIEDSTTITAGTIAVITRNHTITISSITARHDFLLGTSVRAIHQKTKHNFMAQPHTAVA